MQRFYQGESDAQAGYAELNPMTHARPPDLSDLCELSGLS